MNSFSFSLADAGLLIFVGVFAYFGWKNGLLKMGFQFLSFGLSIILSWIFYPHLAEYIKGTAIYGSVLNKVSLVNAAGEGGKNAPNAFAELLEDSTAQMSQVISGYLADIVINIIAFVLMIIAVKIVILIISKILNLFSKLPVLGFFNRLAGVALGFMEGFLVASVILAVIYIFVPTQNNDVIGYYIEESTVTKALYYNNPLIKIALPDA